MHIPDGFLDTKTWVTTAVASASVVGYSVKRAKEKLKDKQIPLMGALATFIFAAQMLNFPVAGGTSGHFLGAALASIFLGPWVASIIMTTVLVVQAFIFADGGITALGANILNMAIIAPFTSFWIYSSFKRFVPRTGKTFGVFMAAWASVVVASASCALELAVSGIVPLHLVLPAMVGWHALIGVGEGIITVTVVTLVSKVRPDLFKLAPKPDYRVLVVGVLIAFFLAFIFSPFASTLPDGLEYVAEKLGFIERVRDSTGLKTPLYDYTVSGIKNRRLATASAGLAGTLLSLAAIYGVSLLLAKRKRKAEPN